MTLRSLPDSVLIGRMVRGQRWIGVLGFLLIGVVAMQVSLLKMNAQIGRDVERSASLLRRNGELRAEVSRLSSGERIQAGAAALGMVMPPAGAVTYLRAGRPGAGQAAAQAVRDGRFAPGAQPSPPPGLPPTTADPTAPGTAATTPAAPAAPAQAPAGAAAPAPAAPAPAPTDQAAATGAVAAPPESGGTGQ